MIEERMERMKEGGGKNEVGISTTVVVAMRQELRLNRERSLRGGAQDFEKRNGYYLGFPFQI